MGDYFMARKKVEKAEVVEVTNAQLLDALAVVAIKLDAILAVMTKLDELITDEVDKKNGR